jgi:hypothetical protein
VPPLLYTAELTLDPGDEEPFLKWYAYRHAPDLYPIGFQVCTCYRAVTGDMTFLDVYEIPGLEIFDSSAYERMAKNDLYAGPLLERRRDKAHTIYEQRLLAPNVVEDGPTLNADWISVLRFNSTMAGDQLSISLSDEVARAMSEGASRVRLAERTRDHPVYTTRRPHFMLMAEWTARPESGLPLLNRLPDQLSGSVSDVIPFIGHRVYPWPDTPPVQS